MERMLHGGADKICFVISPGKSDIMEYYGAGYGGGYRLCRATDARVGCVMPSSGPFRRRAPKQVIVGLPDTVWFPEEALAHCLTPLSFLLFPVGAARIVRRGRARSGRQRSGDPGEAPASGHELGLGRVQDAGGRVLASSELWARRNGRMNISARWSTRISAMEALQSAFKQANLMSM